MSDTARATYALSYPESDELVHRAKALQEASRSLLKTSTTAGAAGRGAEIALDELSRLLEVIETSAPPTAIDEDIIRASEVVQRIVNNLGYQTSLTVYGGGYEERGPGTHRYVRVNVHYDSFDGIQMNELIELAHQANWDLEFSKEHGATLRPIELEGGYAALEDAIAERLGAK